MSRVPPELINYENQMDDFFSDMRRKNEFAMQPCRICHRQGCQGQCQANASSLWADAHMRFHFPESESEADRKFIESVENIRAANKSLPKKRFSWAGLIALLAVALVVGWMVYQAVEAF